MKSKIAKYIAYLVLGNILLLGNLYAKGDLYLDFNYGQTRVFKELTKGLSLPHISKTKEFVDKYFLVRTGLDTYGPNNLSRSTFYSDNFGKRVCEINDSYTDFKVSDDNLILYKKMSALKKCLKIKITDISGTPLSFMENKEKCQFEEISRNSAFIQGSACFFKISPRSKFEVDVIENKDCSNKDYIRRNKISAGSFTGTLQTFIYPESEIGEMFKPLKDFMDAFIYVDINPGNDLFPIFDHFIDSSGYLSSPEIFHFPDVHPTKLIIRNFEENRGQIDISFFVNTIKKENCNSGICSSLFNYDLPLAPEMTILDITNGTRGEWLYTGHVGGRIQNQWQGEFKSVVQYNGFDFETGNRYKMEFLFSDPHYDFTSLVNSLMDLIKSDQFENPFRDLRVGDGEIRVLRNISRRSSIGSLDDLGDDIMAKIPEGLRLQIGNIGDLNDSNFPSLYSKVCNNDGSICREASNNEHMVISLSFTVKGERNGKYKLGDFEIERKSPLMGGFKIKMEKLPTVRCSLKKD